MRYLFSAFLLFALAYMYLYPGSEALFQGKTDVVMSDDTDPAPLPFSYKTLLESWHEDPLRFFFGSVYVTSNYPEGTATWTPWNERWLILAFSPWIPLEQLSTAVVFALVLLNAFAMFALGRYLKWSRSLCLGLSIAWAFSSYVRARAKVHMAFTGIYHLPLIFLALFLIARGRTWRSVAAAAAALILACTVAHYYLVTAAFLAPFFLLFIFVQPEFREDWRRVSARLAMAALPALLFLGFNALNPVPPDANLSTQAARPRTGDYNGDGLHPFLYVYAAKPLDYLVGDIALDNTAADWNPLRELVNEDVLANLGEFGNSHEHTNGIRWSLLALALIGFVMSLKGHWERDTNARYSIWVLTGLGLFAFWLSLPPDWPIANIGPSGWLQQLVPQIRVPSRAGIVVHFAVIMIMGIWISTDSRFHNRWKRIFLIPGLLPTLMILDYPPLYKNMPLAKVRAPHPDLSRAAGPCETGMYFPFVHNESGSLTLYAFLQRLRDSTCVPLNLLLTPQRLDLLATRFPANMNYIRRLPNDSLSALNLERLARCVPLTWIVFDPVTPEAWREGVCRRLGWTMTPELTCVSPNRAQRLERFPDGCL